MTDANQSEASSSVLTSTEDDDVFEEPVAGARAQPSVNVRQNARERQAGGPDEPSLGAKVDVFFERLTEEFKHWVDEHKIDERHQQVLRARFAQTQEIARIVKATVANAVGNVMKRVGDVLDPSNNDAAAQQPRDLKQLYDALSECEKEEVSEERSRKLNEIWAEYHSLTEHDDEAFRKTEDFRVRYYAALLN